MTEYADEFQKFILARIGYAPKEINADGEIHSFSTNGKATHDAGRYFLRVNDDGSAGGWAKCWRQGIEIKWSPSTRITMTTSQRADIKQRIEREQRQRQEETEAKRHECTRKALEILSAATIKGLSQHPYVVRKQVKPKGAHLWKDKVVVPLYQTGAVQSVQLISDSDKKFLTGTMLKGGYGQIGYQPEAETICVTEGWATGASIHEATGQPVIIAFCAGNIPVIAQRGAKRHNVLVCADRDNAGMQAASASGCAWIAPPKDMPPSITDFNDIHCCYGVKMVKELIERAL